jgi:hypothetical protein
MSDWLKRHAERFPGLRKNELDELTRTNGYEVPFGELRQFNRAHIPEVRTFITDISRISHKPAMTELLSLVAGEGGKKTQKMYREMYSDQWENRMRQNDAWGDREPIVKVLALYAQDTGRDADAVWREYHMRTENIDRKR